MPSRIPTALAPMLATPGSLPADERGWAFEFKWDGFRALTFWDGRTLSMRSRNDLEFIGRFPELRGFGKALPGPAIVDGEICALDAAGRPSFSAMQTRGAAERPPIVYFVFDVLHLGGRSLMDLAYLERRERLQGLRLTGDAWQTPAHRIGGGAAMLEVARAQGLEGLIAKRVASRYRAGERTPDWLKVKLIKREEFVVCGYLPGAGANEGLMGALILGYHRKKRGGRRGAAGELVHAGNVGTGFSKAQRRAFMSLLDGTRLSASPFASAAIPRAAVFSKPTVVVEVAFSEWTHDGVLRHPRFLGLRTDKREEQVGDPRG